MSSKLYEILDDNFEVFPAAEFNFDKAAQQIKDLIVELTSHISMTPEERKELFKKVSGL